jgi:hypothetical protein
MHTERVENPQVTICFGLTLGYEAAPSSSVEFPPKVTTYSLPVPVFGDTSAVEGVLTAARHTATEGLAGMMDSPGIQIIILKFLNLVPYHLNSYIW